MLSPAQRGEIRLLSQHGFSQRRIAHLVGRNRATIRKILSSAEPGRPCSPSEPLQRRHRPRPSRKIDPFQAEAFRSITVRGLTVNQTWDVLKAAGFTGSVKSVRRYARELRLQAVKRNRCSAIIRCGKSLLCADHAWLLRLMQGKAGSEPLAECKGCNLPPNEVNALLEQLRNGKLCLRNRAAVVFGRLKGMTFRSISSFLQIGRHTARQYWCRFQSTGAPGLLRARKPRDRKADNQNYRDAVFKILHAPPITYGFNRTTWRLADIKSALAAERNDISRGAIRQIIRLAGFRFRKAKKVLTSTDPKYHAKLGAITRIFGTYSPTRASFQSTNLGLSQ
jgi:transposase